MKKYLSIGLIFVATVVSVHACDALVDFDGDVSSTQFIAQQTINNDVILSQFVFKRSGVTYLARCNTENLQTFVEQLTEKSTIIAKPQMGSRRSSVRLEEGAADASNIVKFILMAAFPSQRLAIEARVHK